MSLNDDIDNIDLYTVLKCEPTDDISTIRRNYMRLARTCHPDKQSLPKSKGHDLFPLISQAYAVFSDPAKRAAYDMLKGHAKSGEYSNLTEMKRNQAAHEVEMMRVSFDVVRSRELSRGGLVIDDAFYGARNIVESQQLDELSSGTDCVLNVTRQMQCAVENSKLVFPAGEPKFVLLPGVYDPAYGKDKLLWVRYYFRGKLHRAIVADEQRLLMPLRSHCVSGGGKNGMQCSGRLKNEKTKPAGWKTEKLQRKRIPPMYWLASVAVIALGFTSLFSFTVWSRGLTVAFFPWRGRQSGPLRFSKQ